MSEATTSAVKQGIRVRTIEETEEMSVCVELQRRIWGYAPIDTVPEQIFIVAKNTGGQVMTAYDARTPVGFALAFAAMREGLAYLHSHMVAVLDEYQNRGVGRMLKLAQRENALDRGINLIEWTLTRCSSRTRTSTSRDSAPSCGATCPIFMGAHPVRCTAGCLRTVLWPSGGCARNGSKRCSPAKHRATTRRPRTRRACNLRFCRAFADREDGCLGLGLSSAAGRHPRTREGEERRGKCVLGCRSSDQRGSARETAGRNVG